MCAYRSFWRCLAAVAFFPMALGQAQAEGDPDPFRLRLELCAAIGAGDAKATAAALDQGAWLDRDCPEQMTRPVLHAVGTGNTTVVSLLLDRGADVNQTDNGVRVTPLHNAAQKTDAPMLRLLLKRGAKVNLLSDEGLSPLYLAALSGDNADAVQVLVEAGADINAADEQGDTVLDVALEEGHQKVAAFLVSKGAQRRDDPGGNAPQTQGPAAAAPEPAPPSGVPAAGNRTADGQLLFKGLYLGMPVEEAARQLLGFGLTPGGNGQHGYPSSMLEESPDGRAPHQVGGPWRGTEPLRIRPDANGVPTLLRDTANPWTMQLDAGNRVQRLSLSGGATSVLFGSADMSGPEFAKAFLDAYGIPEFQAVPVKRGELDQYFSDSLFRMGWEYVDREHGWGLRIEEDKTVTITRLARTAETKFD